MIIIYSEEMTDNLELKELVKIGEENVQEVEKKQNKVSNQHLKLLKSYRDKSLIVAILCKRSYEFYSTIKNFVNIPLILSSTSLAILNSASLTGDQMKIPNIVINSVTGLTLAMINNFKINERVTVFQNISKKMNKLNHRIDEAMINDTESLDFYKITNFIREYETLIEQIDYNFPNSIKKKVYNKFKNTNVSLPNTLIAFDDMAISDLSPDNIKATATLGNELV